MSRSVLSSCVLLSFAVGCTKPPVEAPADLNELARFLTTHYGDAELAELQAGMLSLEEQLAGIDVDGDLDGRAFTMASLRTEDLGGMASHDGFDPEAQVPVGLAGRSAHDFDAQFGTVEETNHVCIESDTTKYYSREFTSDLACFLDGSCDSVTTVNEVRKESILSDIWYDLHKEYRRIPLEDGREVMLARTWADQVWLTDNGNGSFDQTYVLETWIPDGDTTVRFTSMWSSVSLTAVGDDTWSGLVRGGLQQGFEFTDDYLAGFSEELCNNDRDREYDR